MTRDKDPKSMPAAPPKEKVPEAAAFVEEVLPAGEPEPEAEVPRDHLHITEVYRQNLARNMKRLRKLQKLTQTGLAERIGVGQAQIALLEVRKVDASLKSLTRIAQGLGTDPMALLSPPPSSDLVRLPWTEPSYAGEAKAEASDQEVRHGSEADPRPYAAPPAFSGSAGGETTRDELSKPAHRNSPQTAQPPPSPDAVLSSLGQGLNLTVAKHIASAVHKRLEAMERRHGSVPITRPMLNALLVAMLSASQAIDYENEDETPVRP